MIYLNGPGLGATGKAQGLVRNYEAKPADPGLFQRCYDEGKHPKGKVVVVVVENGFFDAAAVADSSGEWDVLAKIDDRPRTILVADLNKVESVMSSSDLKFATENGTIEP
jgi:hypothetical protein